MKTFKIDLSAKRVIPLLYAKQRDVGMKICIELTDNEREYSVPEDTQFSVWFAGKSGSGNYDTIDGRSAFTVDGNKVTVELIYQMLNNPGEHLMCLVMNDAKGNQQGLWNIPYFVEAIPGADSEAATAYYQAFLQVQEKAEEAAGRAEYAASKIELDKEYLEQIVSNAESFANAAEEAARTAADAAAAVANKKPKDVKVTATFDTPVDDPSGTGNIIMNGSANSTAYDIAEAIKNGATVELVDNDNIAYVYNGYRLEPNYSNAFFKAEVPSDKGITVYSVTIDNEGHASRVAVIHEYGGSPDAVLYTPQDLPPEKQAQARENIGITNDPDIHAEYFTITEDGVLSLKPEYRGACPSNRSTFVYAISDNGLGAVGSKNTALPKCLVIPELVDEISVVSLAPGMFMQNQTVESLVLPDGVTEIPDRFCDNAHNLKSLCNTEQIEKIGLTGFQSCGLEKIKCPNLTILGTAAFNNAPFLKYADIGKVTDIPNSAFTSTQMLSRIKGKQVTTIGPNALKNTTRLNHVEFLASLTSVDNYAFQLSSLICDWAKLSTTDIWSGCTATAKENPLPTLLSQYDPRWADRTIGTTNTKYRTACVLFSVMHAYCGLHNLTLSAVDEFVEILNEADPNVLNTAFADGGHGGDVKLLCDALGLNATVYQNYGQAELQAAYDAIAQGKYVLFGIPAPTNHAVLAYGVKANGEFAIADSGFGSAEFVGKGELPIKYSIAYQNVTVPAQHMIIISL